MMIKTGDMVRVRDDIEHWRYNLKPLKHGIIYIVVQTNVGWTSNSIPFNKDVVLYDSLNKRLMTLDGDYLEWALETLS